MRKNYNYGGNGGGIGFFGLLGVLFIALKLTHIIDWKWWIVLSPIWGSILLAIILILIIEYFDHKYK